MKYDELKELVRQESTKSEEYLFMTETIKEIHTYLSDITKKVMDDLELKYPESAISVGSNSKWTTTGISISKRQINFNYHKEGMIKVSCYEPGIIESTLIDILIYKEDAKVVHRDSEEDFELNDIKEYLVWFKK